MTAASIAFSKLASFLHWFFFEWHTSRLSFYTTQENERSLAERKPTTPYQMMLVIKLMSVDSTSRLGWYPSISLRLKEKYGEACIPLIAPALKLGIQQKELELWIDIEEGLMQSEKTPEFFLSLSDEDLLKYVDEHLCRLSEHVEITKRDVVTLVLFFGGVITILAIAEYSPVVSTIFSWTVVTVVGYYTLKFIGRCFFRKETRTVFGLFILDVLDSIRGVFIVLPVKITANLLKLCGLAIIG